MVEPGGNELIQLDAVNIRFIDSSRKNSLVSTEQVGLMKQLMYVSKLLQTCEKVRYIVYMDYAARNRLAFFFFFFNRHVTF